MSPDEALTREQVLRELVFLATVEHALIVEYLSVQCALGHDLPAGAGGPATPALRDAAKDAGRLAVRQMRHLMAVNDTLAAVGLDAQVGRADSIDGIALGPPSLAQLQQLAEREKAIALAVDERYERLRRAVKAPNPALEEQLLGTVQFLLDGVQEHVDEVASLLAALDGLAPADFLRATRRETTDQFEQRLLDVTDKAYGLLVRIVEAWFAQKGSGPFQTWAFDAMFALDDTHRLLVQRGLLPAFTLP